jgi:hypothetical protein
VVVVTTSPRCSNDDDAILSQLSIEEVFVSHFFFSRAFCSALFGRTNNISSSSIHTHTCRFRSRVVARIDALLPLAPPPLLLLLLLLLVVEFFIVARIKVVVF